MVRIVKKTLRLTALATVAVPTRGNVITIEHGAGSVHEHDAYRDSVVTSTPTRGSCAAVPQTSQQTIREKHGNATETASQSDSQTLRSSADDIKASEANNVQTCEWSSCSSKARQRRKVNGELLFLCPAHSSRLQRFGYLDDEPITTRSRTPMPETCTLDGCAKSASRSVRTPDGLRWVCSMHKARWRTHASFDLQKRSKSNNGTKPIVTQRDHSEMVGSNPGQNQPVRLSPRVSAELTFLKNEETPNDKTANNGSSKSNVITLSSRRNPTDAELLERFGPLIDEFARLLSEDADAITDIIAGSYAYGRRDAA